MSQIDAVIASSLHRYAMAAQTDGMCVSLLLTSQPHASLTDYCYRLISAVEIRDTIYSIVEVSENSV